MSHSGACRRSPLYVGAEMEAYGNQAAAATKIFCYKFREEPNRKQQPM